MKKLNRKGYLTIEIIVASVITFIIAFFLIDLTMKLVDNTDNAYVDVLLITDKTLIINNIKKELEKDMLENGSIHKVVCDEDAKKCTITLNNGTLRYLSVNDDNEIKYQKNLDEDETEDIYSKKIHNSLSDISISSSTDHGYYNFKISGENIFIDEDYEMNINVYNKSVPTLVNKNNWFNSESYDRIDIDEIRFVDKVDKNYENSEESWGAAEGLNEDEITCYINEIDGRLILTIAGNGTGKIYANPDSSLLFGADVAKGQVPFGSLKKISNLEILDTSLVTNMLGMFASTDNLTSDGLDLSKFDTSNVTNMQGMFFNCLGLTEINLSSFDTSKVTNMVAVFEKCENLEKIIFYEPDGTGNFDTSKVTNMSFLFHGCKKLTSLDLEKFNTSSVTTMKYMFTRCNSLGSLDLSKFDTSKVTDMSYMFYGCHVLEELVLSDDFDTSQVTSMFAMFYECSKLTKLDLSSFDTSKVISMRSMFNKCKSLTKLNLSNFKTANVLDMSFMFLSCENLEEVDISSFIPKCVQYIAGMFQGCNSLKKIYASNYWENKLNYDGLINDYDMFNNDYNLVGGCGTQYDDDYNNNVSFARIDKVCQNGQEGLFTRKEFNDDYSIEVSSCDTDYIYEDFEEENE